MAHHPLDPPPSGSALAVEAHGLTKRFGDVEALRGVDLAVPAGTVFGLLGPNGAGKTTIVRILSTLSVPTGGTARVAGLDVVADADRVRQRIGLAGQHAAVDERHTGRDNLRMFGRLSHLSKAAADRRADDLLEEFDLTHAGRRLVSTYSGGMRRRLDLVASLITAPAVLFLDEPTTGLDPRSRADIWATVRRLVAGGTTVLLTTQYLDEADQLADRIAVIDHGRVVAQGTPRELKAAMAQRVDVTVADPRDLEQATVTLADLFREPAENPDARTVRLPVLAGAVDATTIVRALDAVGVIVADLTIGHPSLDDVFLEVTDQSAAPDAPVDPSASLAPAGKDAA